MSVIENQEHLIAQTQLLYGDLLNAGKYAEAIAISKVILDLSVAYREVASYPPIAKSFDTTEPFSSAFGQATFGQINQTLREVTQPKPQLGEIRYSQHLSQPSQYAWADGFQGVVVPPREIDAPNLPNPNNISSRPTDYWEDSRRQ